MQLYVSFASVVKCHRCSSDAFKTFLLLTAWNRLKRASVESPNVVLRVEQPFLNRKDPDGSVNKTNAKNSRCFYLATAHTRCILLQLYSSSLIFVDTDIHHACSPLPWFGSFAGGNL
jgi:hypothetical protein